MAIGKRSLSRDCYFPVVCDHFLIPLLLVGGEETNLDCFALTSTRSCPADLRLRRLYRGSVAQHKWMYRQMDTQTQRTSQLISCWAGVRRGLMIFLEDRPEHYSTDHLKRGVKKTTPPPKKNKNKQKTQPQTNINNNNNRKRPVPKPGTICGQPDLHSWKVFFSYKTKSLELFFFFFFCPRKSFVFVSLDTRQTCKRAPSHGAHPH